MSRFCSSSYVYGWFYEMFYFGLVLSSYVYGVRAAPKQLQARARDITSLLCTQTQKNNGYNFISQFEFAQAVSARPKPAAADNS